jgi:hypothetical protein
MPKVWEVGKAVSEQAGCTDYAVQLVV